MISAGKASARRSTDRARRRVPRQRHARAPWPWSNARRSASRSSSATKIRSCRRRAAAVGDGRRQQPDDADRSRSPAIAPRRACPARARAARSVRRPGTDAAARAAARAERRRTRSTTPVHVEEVHLAAGARPVLGRAAPVHASHDRAFSPPARVNRAPISKSAHVPAAMPAVVRDRVDQAGQQRRPQRVEHAPTAGWRRRPAPSPAPGRTRAAALASMNPNVTASDRPAAVSTSRSQPVALNARIGRRRRRVIGGKRRLERSKP